ncbi:MAG: 50S ribosomal protein L9 [Gammaproteobacteria bacterium]|nr:50S ribosomal protein L9 [Gammaproteobacteria bacterium]
MEIILLEKIRNLGALGDKVNVKPGFARNFLIPQGLAVPANKDNLKAFEARLVELELASKERLAAAKKRAETLEGLVVTMAARSAEGKLYGSLTVRDVAEAITAAAGMTVAKSELQMPEGPIRYLGEYDFMVELHSDVESTIKVVVVEDK